MHKTCESYSIVVQRSRRMRQCSRSPTPTSKALQIIALLTCNLTQTEKNRVLYTTSLNKLAIETLAQYQNLHKRPKSSPKAATQQPLNFKLPVAIRRRKLMPIVSIVIVTASRATHAGKILLRQNIVLVSAQSISTKQKRAYPINSIIYPRCTLNWVKFMNFIDSCSCQQA